MSTPPLIAERELEREVRRFFRRFIEPRSFAAPAGNGEFGLFVARTHWRRPVVRIEWRIWEAIERRDLARREEREGGKVVWLPSVAGLAYWRRLEDQTADPFRAQHQLRGRATLKEDGKTFSVEINDGESSLGWLRRRKGSNGKPLISETQFEAGEKLRTDFTLACMSPRVTTDGSMALGPGGRNRPPRDPSEVTDRALAARERLSRALDAVGGSLSDLLLEVCCHLRGLEEAERGFGWPRRSGKVVLQIALDRLAVHYGLGVTPSQLRRRP